MNAFLLAAGIALLAILAIDCFLTVLHGQGRGGPLTYFLARWTWRISRRLTAGAQAEKRAQFLALSAPLLLIATVATWVLLLVGGFALLYLPWIENFLVSPGTLRNGTVEALYFSGYTAATLGFGDLVPDSNVMRLLAPFEAFCGFALLSSAITYVLAPYRELLRMRALAVIIDSYVGAAERRAASPGDDRYEAMTTWAENTHRELLHTLQAHHQYPILHYFHPQDPAAALPLQLGRLIELRAEARNDSSESGSTTLASDPSFVALWDAVERYHAEIDRHFIPDAFETPTSAQGDETEKIHFRLLSYLCYD